VFSGAQAIAVADISDGDANGLIHLTTRQNAQLYDMSLTALPKVLRSLQVSGLSTFHGAGDVARNIVSCPGAGSCSYRAFDVTTVARQTQEALTADRSLDNLPHKLKISFNGCEGSCGMPYMNDIGAVAVRAVVDNGRIDGFSVMIGGGHGRHPALAQPLFGFVPREKIQEVCRAIAMLFRDLGDRQNRSTARLKYLTTRLGIDRCREHVKEIINGVGITSNDLLTGTRLETRAVPTRFHTRYASVGADELLIQQVHIRNGQIASDQLRRLAAFSEMYGDGFLRATCRQNLEIRGVRRENASTIQSKVETLGFGTTRLFGLSDIVACIGSRHCPMAMVSTHDMTDLLDFVCDESYDDIREFATIHITGCANACSPYKTADIGLRGVRMRDQFESAAGYEIAIGGSSFLYGQPIGTYLERDCPNVVAVLLDTFRTVMKSGEYFSEAVQRVGLEPFTDAVSALDINHRRGALRTAVH
jgi:sulfite reductase beta subunit-like hemoprotein